ARDVFLLGQPQCGVDRRGGGFLERDAVVPEDMFVATRKGHRIHLLGASEDKKKEKGATSTLNLLFSRVKQNGGPRTPGAVLSDHKSAHKKVPVLSQRRPGRQRLRNRWARVSLLPASCHVAPRAGLSFLRSSFAASFRLRPSAARGRRERNRSRGRKRRHR